MTTLAFLCTGRNDGWNPVCNSTHFLVLVIAGLGVASVVATLLSRNATAVGKGLIWLSSIVTCLMLSFVIGFSVA